MQENIREKVKELLVATKIGVSKDFSPEEKKELFDHFEQFGLSAATCRNRLFRDGWREWELKGILGCIIDYGKRSEETMPLVIEAEKLQIDDPIEAIYATIQEFYDTVNRKLDFCEYMYSQGMSTTTACSHFKNPSQLTKWEVFGMLACAAAKS